MPDSYVVALKLKHAQQKFAYYEQMLPRAAGTEYYFSVQTNMDKYSKLIEQYSDYLELAAVETYLLNESFSEIIKDF